MKDISYIAAFPKSGITYLNFMLFHILFDRPQDVRLIDSDYIFDVHESLARVPPPGDAPRYVKIHFSYSPRIPLPERASRAVYLLRDPIDVMMSVWDFKHLIGEDGLLEASPADHAAMFQRFCQHWVTTGGLIYPWAGSWKDNVASWLDQSDLPLLVVRYEQLKAQPFEELRRILVSSAVRQPMSASRRRSKPASPTICASSNPKRSTRVFPAFFIGPDWRRAMPRLSLRRADAWRIVGKNSQSGGPAICQPDFRPGDGARARPRRIVSARAERHPITAIV